MQFPGRGQVGEVPAVSILVAFVLVIASIVVLVSYVHHLGQSLRVAALIELVGQETRELVDELYPDKGEDAPVEPGVLVAPTSGVVFHFDCGGLVREARKAGCALELVPAIGDFVPAGRPSCGWTLPTPRSTATRSCG